MRKTDNRPVGVFDSGLGGISTLRQALQALPGERFVYYGDNANAPYGSRGRDELCALLRNAVNRLADLGAKAVLVACNTSTNASVELLRAELPLPLVGITPAILRAEERVNGQGVVLALATEATMKMPRYGELRKRLKNPQRVKDIPTPSEVVRRVEQGLLGPDSYDDILEEILTPYQDESVTAIVLGCTHYAFIQEQIASFVKLRFGWIPAFYDGGLEAVQGLQALLQEQGMEAAAPGEGERVRFFTSGDAEKLRPLFDMLMERPFTLSE